MEITTDYHNAEEQTEVKEKIKMKEPMTNNKSWSDFQPGEGTSKEREIVHKNKYVKQYLLNKEDNTETNKIHTNSEVTVISYETNCVNNISNTITHDNKEANELHCENEKIQGYLNNGNLKFDITCNSKGERDKKEGTHYDLIFSELSVFYNKDFTVKIIVAGDSDVGKTALIERFLFGTFSGKYNVTLGIEYSTKQIKWGCNTRIKAQFWDMHGNRDHKWIVEGACHNVHAAIIVFDASRIETLCTGATMWIGNIKDMLQKYTSTQVPFILLANKCDLPNANANSELLSTYCYDNELDGWFVTSAKEGTDVETAMTFVIRSALQTFMEEEQEEKKGFRLNKSKRKSKKSCF